MNYPGFLMYITEAAFCVFFKSDLVMGIKVTVATGEALMLRQSGHKHNQWGLQLALYKNKGIVSSWNLKVIFCLSLLIKSFALLEVVTEKLCLNKADFFFLVFFVLLSWFMPQQGTMDSSGF